MSAPGPFAYDLSGGVGITATAATSTLALDKGRAYAFVEVDDTTGFTVSGGYIVFNFGYSNQVGPIKYTRVISETRLLLDGSYKMTDAVPVGSDVRLLYTKAPYVNQDATTGTFYLTASTAGHVAARQTFRDISATGIDLEVNVRYPGDRGLGGEGLPTKNNYKLSDIVSVFGGDDLDEELPLIKEGQ